MKRGGRLSRNHRIELIVTSSILVIAFFVVMPRFLHQQRSYTFVIENCDSLDEWSVLSGNWSIEDSTFECLPNNDGVTDWVLIHDRNLDATLLNYPVALLFDCALSAIPPPMGSIWIGLGFGWSPQSDSKEHLPTLASVLRIENGVFQGVFMRTSEGAWLGQYSEGPVQVWDPVNKIYNSFQNIEQAYQLSKPNAVPSATVPITAGPIGPASGLTLSQSFSRFPPNFREKNARWFLPAEWYRTRCYLDGFDPQTGAVGFNLHFTSLSYARSWPPALNGRTISSPVPCFPFPRQGLVLYIRQTSKPIPIRIDNIRMRMRHYD